MVAGRMTDPDGLLQDLELFVENAVQFAYGDNPATLADKMNVLGRVVELLRLQTGRLVNDFPMPDLLKAGVCVRRTTVGALTIVVGGEGRAPGVRIHAPNGWRESELQVPLLLSLMSQVRPKQRVGTLIDAFVAQIRDRLSPADVETTKTGVPRIVTTIRLAARTLRLHGLLTFSEETAYKTWEPSVLGLLVGVAIVEKNKSTQLEDRSRALIDVNHLAAPLIDVLQEFANPGVVSQLVHKILGPNRDVFDSYDRAINVVTNFCARFYGASQSADHPRHELRAAAKALLSELSSALQPGELARDILVDRALKSLTENR